MNSLLNCSTRNKHGKDWPVLNRFTPSASMITVSAQSTAQPLAFLPVRHGPLWALRPKADHPRHHYHPSPPPWLSHMDGSRKDLYMTTEDLPTTSSSQTPVLRRRKKKAPKEFSGSGWNDYVQHWWAGFGEGITHSWTKRTFLAQGNEKDPTYRILKIHFFSQVLSVTKYK